jgi:hypothetical protein
MLLGVLHMSVARQSIPLASMSAVSTIEQFRAGTGRPSGFFLPIVRKLITRNKEEKA